MPKHKTTENANMMQICRTVDQLLTTSFLSYHPCDECCQLELDSRPLQTRKKHISVCLSETNKSLSYQHIRSYINIIPMRPIFMPERARALSADWAPGPGVLVLFPLVALNLMWRALTPSSCHHNNKNVLKNKPVNKLTIVIAN